MSSRLGCLVDLLGGEENLPPKIITHQDTQTQSSQPLADDEHQHETPSEGSADEWWKKLPVIVAPSPPVSRGVPSTRSTIGVLPTSVAPGTGYCPFIAVTKFCYNFVPKKWMQPLATAFFDARKIFERNWDIYYIWSEHHFTPKPVTFVPEHQVLTLLDEINETFPAASISIDNELRDNGFVISFDEFKSSAFHPHFLGRCDSKLEYEQITMALSEPDPLAASENEERTVAAFKAKIDLAREITKNRSNANKKRRHSEQMVKRQHMADQLVTVSRYLGLLPPADRSLDAKMASLQMSAINVEALRPYEPEVEYILISIDVEAYEKAQQQITEVGVATLDIRDLKDMAPGRIGENWQKAIRSRHFRIDEYKHLVNQEFVQGCPDRFEFGTSEFISLKNLTKTLTTCFHPPYSKAGSKVIDGETRQLILVGHAVDQDVRYLQSIGFDVFNRGNLNSAIDTASMYRAHTRNPNATSLGNVLYEFDLAGFNLHNAGNDATYTLWALLAIAVQHAAERGLPIAEEKRQQVMDERARTAIEQAKLRVQEDAEGWDGSDALPPAESGGVYYTETGAIVDT